MPDPGCENFYIEKMLLQLLFMELVVWQCLVAVKNGSDGKAIINFRVEALSQLTDVPLLVNGVTYM